jgi:hypothetical protein
MLLQHRPLALQIQRSRRSTHPMLCKRERVYLSATDACLCWPMIAYLTSETEQKRILFSDSLSAFSLV